MVLKRNTQVGKNNFKLIYLVFLFYFCLFLNSNAKSNLEGTFTDIKILDKISSKNTLLKIKNGELTKFKDLSIKSLKCKNSEFLHLRLLIDKSLNFISSPFFSLSKVFLELILSKILRLVKVPSKLTFEYELKTKEK